MDKNWKDYTLEELKIMVEELCNERNALSEKIRCIKQKIYYLEGFGLEKYKFDSDSFVNNIFGKKKSELSDFELREYNKLMQRISRERKKYEKIAKEWNGRK